MRPGRLFHGVQNRSQRDINPQRRTLKRSDSLLYCCAKTRERVLSRFHSDWLLDDSKLREERRVDSSSEAAAASRGGVEGLELGLSAAKRLVKTADWQINDHRDSLFRVTSESSEFYEFRRPGGLQHVDLTAPVSVAMAERSCEGGVCCRSMFSIPSPHARESADCSAGASGAGMLEALPPDRAGNAFEARREASRPLGRRPSSVFCQVGVR
jgi:hypothetical protein